MKIVIEMPDIMYDWLNNGFPDDEDYEKLLEVVKNGIILPKYHGDLVDRAAINNRFDSIYDEAMGCSCAPTYKYLLDKFSMCLDTEKPIIEGTYDEDENNE